MLNITQITISDEISQLAKNCHLDLVAQPADQGLAAEFALPGDSQSATATDLRPNGAKVDVNLIVNNLPETIFSGMVEFTDDLADPNKYNYGIDMSDLPVGEPNRNLVSKIFNQAKPLGGYTDVSSHHIIHDVCSAAGLSVGRIDLPDYNVWGNFEVIRKTPVEVAEELCQPFNAFQHTKYHVRCDRNGLQIIKVDYALGAETSIVYAIPNIKKSTRTFKKYQPDGKIGASDVLLTGGDVYGNDGVHSLQGSTFQTFTQSTQAPNDVINNDPVPTDIFPQYANAGNPPLGNLAQLEWTETVTQVEFVVTLTKNNPDDGHSIDTTPLTIYSNLDDNIAQLQSGVIDDIKVNETFILQQETWQYLSGVMYGKTVTVNETENKVFSNGTIVNRQNFNAFNCVEDLPTFLTPKRVQVYSTTYEFSYSQGVEIPTYQTRKHLIYSVLGVVEYTISTNYYFDRGAWVLVGTTIDTGDPQEFTNATIQFYDSIRSVVPPTVAQGAKTNIGKYQLRNGLQVLPVRLQRDPCTLTENGQIIKDFKINNAYQVSCPYMDYNGLALIWKLAQKQIALEQSGAYWEEVKIDALYDMSPVVGESVVTDGSGGILETLTHTIDADQAVSSFGLRRLIT